jgi:hypothetical protein
MILLCDADITHYVAGRSLSSSLSTPVDVSGLHNPVAAAAQPHPSKSHYGDQGQGRPPSHHPQGHQGGSQICCELCLDRFGFSSHEAPWCPFLHPGNIKD